MVGLNQTGSITFTFQGDYEVEARTFANTISQLVTMSEIIAEKNYPDTKFGLSVRAIQPGSLSFDFVASAAAIIPPLFSPPNIQYANTMVQIIKGCFEVKRFLKGEKPKAATEEGKNLVIERQNGDKITVPYGSQIVFNDNRVDQSVQNVFNGAIPAVGVKGISLKIENDKPLEIPREEFEACAVPLEAIGIKEKSKQKQVMRYNELLFVRKPDFWGDSQWGFRDAEKNIDADMADKEFAEKIQSGKCAIKGKMYIIADLQLTLEVDASGFPVEGVKPKYTVVKVHSLNSTIDDNQQEELFD